MKILFIANNNIGNGLSGGDRIFIELIRYWKKHSSITLMGAMESINLLKRYALKDIPVIISDPKLSRQPLLLHTIKRLFKSFKIILNNPAIFSEYELIYSVSDFLPDLLPALLLKFLHPQKKWIAGFYLFAPNPFSLKSPYNQTGQSIKGALYFITQIFTRLLVNQFADLVYITSEPDRRYFKPPTIVIRGGVDIKKSQKYLRTNSGIPIEKRQYDAVFQGRLHPQKGILILVDIWKRVCCQRPNSLLAIIGDGPLESELKSKIKKLKLGQNIKLFGFLDNNKKYYIFKNSKIVVHPSIYDSGGMSAAEAMAWGLPAVSFDLESLKTYYPQGMIKTKCFDTDKFAQNIIKLLNKQKIYQKTSSKALELIINQWDWKKQSQNIWVQTINHL